MNDFDRAVVEFMCEYGSKTTYKHVTGSVPDDSTGKVVQTFEDIEIQAIKMELLPTMSGSGTKQGALIQQADQMLYVRPVEKADRFADVIKMSAASDRVVINGSQWKVVTIKEYNPSASNCYLYELYIKK